MTDATLGQLWLLLAAVFLVAMALVLLVPTLVSMFWQWWGRDG